MVIVKVRRKKTSGKRPSIEGGVTLTVKLNMAILYVTVIYDV